MQYNFDINNRAFKAIKKREKRVEIRVTKNKNSFDYSILKCNDEILFKSMDGEIIKCQVEEINWYSNIEELLILEGTRYTLSSTNDFDEGVKSINNIDGYKEGIIKNGVYAIHIKCIDS
jgi:ASC-1-like (ASCH) protein